MRMIVMLSLWLVAGAAAAEEPVIPEKAPCVVCSFQGEGHGPEKVAAHSAFEGTLYFFCATGCKERFDEDPRGYLPFSKFPAPDFAVTACAGEPVRLGDYEGQWLFLDFWATWCQPCVKLMPAMEELGEAFAPRGLTILGVSIDEDAKKARKFLEKHEIGYPTAMDNADEPAWAAFRVKVVPTAYLIDPTGTVVQRWVGAWEHDAVAKELDALLPKDPE